MSDHIGRIHVGAAGAKSGGKAIDEWEFFQPFSGGERFKIAVFMRKRFDAETPGGQRIEFVAECKALPEGRLASSDIEKLRLDVDAVLREQSILRSGVVWEDWLEVVVRGAPKRFHGTKGAARKFEGEELSIEYRVLKRGRHPEDPSRDFTINFNHVATPFPKPKRAGEKTMDWADAGSLKGFVSDGRDEAAEYAYVKDTPENRAALDDLMSALRLLGQRLSTFLGQESIEGAVATLRANALLQLPQA